MLAHDEIRAGASELGLGAVVDDSFASYGDGGGFFVVIPRVDLAVGRYDRAVAESQSL